MLREIEDALANFEASEESRPLLLEIDDESRTQFVQLRTNPNKFIPRIFDGDWAETARHPDLGDARLLRVIRGTDNVARAIVRQGRSLFVYPFI